MESETQKIFKLEAAVSFGDVDRDNLLNMRGVFKLLQEGAIAHANVFDTGTDAMLTRGESWVLNRLAVEVLRYPSYGERLHLETWSSGIVGFRGFRDFRVRDSAGQLVMAGSSLWVFVNIRTQSIMRVPKELAERFPSLSEGVFCPDIEQRPLGRITEVNTETRVSLRYSDFDANHHLNNTAYLDLLQAALARQGLQPRPTRVLIKYSKAIPSSADEALIRLAPATDSTLFTIESQGQVCAQGLCGPAPFPKS